MVVKTTKKAGAQVGDVLGLRKYLAAALTRLGCSLTQDQIIEVEEFLMKKYWDKGKSVPTLSRTGKRDVAVRWALRQLLKDPLFKGETVSIYINQDGEEVDIFDVVGKEDVRFQEFEKLHDFVSLVGYEPALALLKSAHSSNKIEKIKRRKPSKAKKPQASLF